jgi:succinate-semialdehyde dehydrogenase / glutarate-semialdehyde dehydrogenase
MAGNAVVLKPDSQTVLTSLWAVCLAREAGLPEGVLQIVVGPGSVIGTAMIERADFMMFTGSTRTGREVAARCADRLIGCSLELGGKNALLVLEDADLDRAADIVLRGAFASAGQLCISIERLLVHENVKEQFLARFIPKVLALRLSADVGWGGDMGSMASQAQFDSVRSHVDDAVAKGATVLAGGRPRPDIGPLMYEPTVLDGVTPDMVVCEQETFGPVVSVYTFATEEEAIARANATHYGLNASVVTRDVRHGRRIAARLQAGTVNINEGYAAAWGSVAAPMGGMGHSGLGRRHGDEGLLKYTEAQTIATQRIVGFGPQFGMSDEQWAGVLTRGIGLVKKVGLR